MRRIHSKRNGETHQGPETGRRRRGAARLLLLLCIAIWIHPVIPEAQAQPVRERIGRQPEAPWEIKAAEVEYDSRNDVYIARGGVVIRSGDIRLTADTVRFDRKNSIAHAQGHVVLSTREDYLTGDRIDINLEDQTGIIYQASVFLKENHFYLKGERIEKVGPDEYRAYKASITTCEGDRPDWKITGRDLHIKKDGYGTVRNAAFWARNIPVMYTPFFFFPAKFKRETGLLTPQFGRSERRGLEYRQPFFWAVNENTDATLYNHYMTDRGNKVGAEYRYMLDPISKGSVKFDYLDDQKVDDGAGNGSDDYGYDQDAYLRPNSDRYWFRMKADQALPREVTGRLDLDIVSDQDYLYEFKNGYSGFDDTRSDFIGLFGREIDDYNDPIRTNRLNLNKKWPYYSLNAEALWYDNVINRRWEDTDTTLQRLPFISLNSSKQPIGDTPLYWSVDTEYTHFYRQDGTRGHRTDLYSRAYVPFQYQRRIFFEPSLGVRETLWHINRFKGEEEDRERNANREMMDIRLDVTSDLFRVYALDPDRGGLLKRLDLWPGKIRHLIRPQLIYEYVPDVDQEDYPFFDALDRLERKNRFTLALIQTFVSRTPAPLPKDADTAENKSASSTYRYHRFCRIQLQQSYDLNEFRGEDELLGYNFSDRTNPEIGERLSPLYADIELAPSRFFSIAADAEWSHNRNDFRSRNIALNLRDGRGDRASIEHRYTRDFTESLLTSLTLQWTRRISTVLDLERNMRDGETVKTGLGLRYSAQCWSVNFRYLNEQDDHSYGFMVYLNGLGGIGTD